MLKALGQQYCRISLSYDRKELIYLCFIFRKPIILNKHNLHNATLIITVYKIAYESGYKVVDQNENIKAHGIVRMV